MWTELCCPNKTLASPFLKVISKLITLPSTAFSKTLTPSPLSLYELRQLNRWSQRNSPKVNEMFLNISWICIVSLSGGFAQNSIRFQIYRVDLRRVSEILLRGRPSNPHFLFLSIFWILFLSPCRTLFHFAYHAPNRLIFNRSKLVWNYR